jgi:hypothetical protein
MIMTLSRRIMMILYRLCMHVQLYSMFCIAIVLLLVLYRLFMKLSADVPILT